MKNLKYSFTPEQWCQLAALPVFTVYALAEADRAAGVSTLESFIAEKRDKSNALEIIENVYKENFLTHSLIKGVVDRMNNYDEKGTCILEEWVKVKREWRKPFKEVLSFIAQELTTEEQLVYKDFIAEVGKRTAAYSGGGQLGFGSAVSHYETERLRLIGTLLENHELEMAH